MQIYLQSWALSILVSEKQIGDSMTSSDWLDIRGWSESIIGWSMDTTHDFLPNTIQTEFAKIQLLQYLKSSWEILLPLGNVSLG